MDTNKWKRVRILRELNFSNSLVGEISAHDGIDVISAVCSAKCSLLVS